jgi:hypothetical protein
VTEFHCKLKNFEQTSFSYSINFTLPWCINYTKKIRIFYRLFNLFSLCLATAKWQWKSSV